MKLDDLLQEFYESSGTASTLNRQLAFAGLALIWIFKIEEGNNLKLANGTEIPALFILLSLTLDFFQYLYKTVLFWTLHKIKEVTNFPKNKNFTIHPILNWPTNFFFLGKIIFLGLAYIFLINFSLKEFIFLS